MVRGGVGLPCLPVVARPGGRAPSPLPPFAPLGTLRRADETRVRCAASAGKKGKGAPMAFQLSNPLRGVLRYMRGDDIREANARTLERNRAEQAADRAAAGPILGPAPTSPAATRPAQSRRL